MNRICRLCVTETKRFEILYDKSGDSNELCDIVKEFFHPEIVNMELAKNLTCICCKCYRSISLFHVFQKSVLKAQKKINPYLYEIDIKSEVMESDELNDSTELLTEANQTKISLNSTKNSSWEEIFERQLTHDDGSRDNDNTEKKNSGEEEEQSKELRIAATFSLADVSKTQVKEESSLIGTEPLNIELCAAQPTMGIIKIKQEREDTYETTMDDGFAVTPSPTKDINTTNKLSNFFNPAAISRVSAQKICIKKPPGPISEDLAAAKRKSIENPFNKDKDEQLKITKNSARIVINKQRMVELQKSTIDERRITLKLPENNTKADRNDMDKKILRPKKSTALKKTLFTTALNNTKADKNDMDKKILRSKKSTALKKTLSTTALKRYYWELDVLVGKWMPTIKCNLCDSQFEKLSLLRCHFDDIHRDEEFYMVCCNLKLGQRTDVQSHFLNHDKTSGFKCDICGFTCSFKTGLQRHTLQAHPESLDHRYVCTVCGQISASMSGLARHTAGAHNIPWDKKAKQFENAGRKFHSCKECQKEFITYLAFRQHTYMKDGMPDQYKCRLCKMLYNLPCGLRKHMETHNERYAELDENQYDEADEEADEGGNDDDDDEKFYVGDVYEPEDEQLLQEEDDFEEPNQSNYSSNTFKVNQSPKNPNNESNNSLNSFKIKIEPKEFEKTSTFSSRLEQERFENYPILLQQPSKISISGDKKELIQSRNIRKSLKTNHNDQETELMEFETVQIDIKRKRSVEEDEEPNEIFATTKNGVHYFTNKLINLDIIIAKWMPVIKCVHCTESFSKFTLLSKHFSSQHPLNQLHMFCCNSRLANIEEICDHFHLHNKKDGVTCYICHRSYSCKRNLKMHLAFHHGGNTASSRVYMCIKCGKHFSKENLAQHMIQEHGEQLK